MTEIKIRDKEKTDLNVHPKSNGTSHSLRP